MMTASEKHELPYMSALEAQLRAAHFISHLTFNDELARACLALFFATDRGTRPPFEAMLSTSLYTWQRLASHVLWWATPCAWDAEAALWTEQASQHVGGGRSLAPDAMPFGRGWWWFGSAPLLRAEDHLCALTWETHATGIYLYPCLVKGCWDESEPYRLGPIAFGGIQIDFGVSLNDLHREWSALGLPAYLKEILTWEVRFVIAACAALSRGDLATYPVPVLPEQHPRLMQQYQAESLPPAVHVIKMRVDGVPAAASGRLRPDARGAVVGNG